MTEPTLTRPAPAPTPGRLDEPFYDLVEARFRRLIKDHPELATYVGIHTEDHRLGDASRERVLEEIERDRAHLAAVEALDPAELSAEVRFERDLEVHNVRLELFDLEVHRVWERRSTAMDGVGDGLFSVFARDFAPLAERLVSLAGRIEAIPRFLSEHRTRAVRPPVRLWQQLEIHSGDGLPAFLDEIVASGERVLAESDQRRLSAAARQAKVALADYASWVREGLGAAVDDWPLGRETYDQLVQLRAFDGLDADAILETGRQQLAANKAARVAVARQINPTVDEPTVVDRIKSDHPATFEAALGAYRDAMTRARKHLIDRDLVTVPADERLVVIPTPEYLRNVLPFAAYFDAPKFDPNPHGIYVVTPSVDDDPGAMREHNYSSISNTSVHEAYPGHHLQMAVAGQHPSLTRLMTNAPEFVEGWGMYSELMMREEGFDDAPNFWLNVHTDAIWRACRIILDIRLHRGEIGVDEAVAFMIGHTSFEESNARAEVNRYTYTPTYQLSYLLGRVLLLQLRQDERARLGASFRLKDFHDTLLRNGSIPISFHRRLLREGLAESPALAAGSTGRT